MAGPDRGPMRAIALAGGLGFVLGLTALVGAFLGRYLDQRWGTGPWLTLVGTLVGTAAGFYEVTTVLKQLAQKSNGAPDK